MSDLITRLTIPAAPPIQHEAAVRIEALERSCDRHAQMHENLVLQRDGLLNRVEALERELTDVECEANTLRGQLAEAQAVLNQAREALVSLNSTLFNNDDDYCGTRPHTLAGETLAAIDAVLAEGRKG